MKVLTFIINDPSIIKINNQEVEIEWSPLNHRYFPTIFQNEIMLLYKCLKRIQLLTD